MRQILWGLFKKIVIADNCAMYVNDIFANYGNYSGSTLFLGIIFFAFQIYGDFSGYSDIAIGTSRLFGFNLMRNFAFPYFSRDIAEFWRRWHISLSTWFRDYVYIPLGGSRVGTCMKIRNTFVIFILCGFWHGANWTFVAWGALNAIYFLPLMVMNKNRKYINIVAEGKLFPSIKEIFQIAFTFFITVIAWVFFRAESIFDAVCYIRSIFSISLFSIPEVFPKKVLVSIFFLLIAEWIQRAEKHSLEFDKIVVPISVRWGLYYGIIWTILYFGGSQQEFIYFQF
jgi:alginate O-acetyltransferase complex protein AlgI